MSFGNALRQALAERGVTPFIGVYDVFSASIAAQHYDALFVSGFGFAASHYGLPDIGFIAWPDIVAFVERIRTVLPSHHLLVDIDDGYCDADVACHVVSLLERAGASGVVLEDQRRPRRCGHFDGKQLLDLGEFVVKLERVLATRRELFVVARTDASDLDDIFARVEAFVGAGADAVLVDGIRDLDVLRALRKKIDLPIAFNQIAGGKSRPCTTTELMEAGATMIIYSTPCLFAAQQAVDDAIRGLAARDGLLPPPTGGEIGVAGCTQVLSDNLARRDAPRAGDGFTLPDAREWMHAR